MGKSFELGKNGEDMAVAFLRKAGHEILDINWRYNHFELDIISRDKGELVITEVKTCLSHNYGEPEDAVSLPKIKRTVIAADHYIRLNDIDLPVRFDIIGIIENDSKTEIKHIKDAFYPPLG